MEIEFIWKKNFKRREPMNSMTMLIVQRRWEKLSGKKEQKEVEVERSGQVVRVGRRRKRL